VTFQKALRESSSEAYCFKEGKDGHWHICDSDGAEYHSKSWDQEAQHLNDGIDRRDLPSKSYEDYAVITKTENPWSDKTKVLWIAGIRGIGTWGAAECIKKEWKQIYDLLPADKKDSCFSALLKIEYDNCDIIHIDVRRVIPLPR
jgi:hypothetical protein